MSGPLTQAYQEALDSVDLSAGSVQSQALVIGGYSQVGVYCSLETWAAVSELHLDLEVSQDGQSWYRPLDDSNQPFLTREKTAIAGPEKWRWQLEGLEANYMRFNFQAVGATAGDVLKVVALNIG